MEAQMAMTSLRYIDLGLTSAKEFWSKVVLPDYDEFKQSHTARDAVHAALSAWHLSEWVFCEQPPSTQKEDFRKDLIKACPELGLVRDYAETAKHRGLSRGNIKVSKVEPDSRVESVQHVHIGDFGSVSIAIRGTSAVTMFLDDGTSRQFSDVLSCVIDYWRTRFPC
jgi:hypothetical protein